jgi:hypothetical protein
MVYIGFDNGVTSQGIGVVFSSGVRAELLSLPVKRERSYTKEEKHITRIDHTRLLACMQELVGKYPKEEFLVGLERPMVNSTRFNASLSAIRALEATLIVLETLGLNYEYIDSKEWQKALLPKDTKGSDELKKASLELGKELFPDLKIKKDADGLLIAEYLRIKYSQPCPK